MDAAIATASAVRRGPGRPPGSKNKKPPKMGYVRSLETQQRAPNGSAVVARSDAGLNAAEELMLIKRDLARMDLEERKGELISKKQLLAALASMHARFRARLRAIPTQWVAQYVDPSKLQQGEAALRAMIDEALAELSSGDALGA